jgi:hypothetical protein
MKWRSALHMAFGRILVFLVVAWASIPALAGPPRFNGAVSGLGTPAWGQPGRMVRIDESTRHISVEHLEVVTITNAQGRTFAWKFDTGHVPTGFPLRRVAPPGFDAGLVWVYIDRARVPVP